MSWNGSWNGAWEGSWLGNKTFVHGHADDGKRRNIIKPLGLPPRKKLAKQVEEQQQVVQEVLNKQVALSPTPVIESTVQYMSLAEIDFEIKTLLHKKYKTDEEEALLLILIAANI